MAGTASKISDGQSVRVTIPNGQTVTRDTFDLVRGWFGLALQTGTAGQDVIIQIEQCEYQTDQIVTAENFGMGAIVYWDNDTKLLTVNPDPDVDGVPQNQKVGRVTTAKDANNVIELVLGPQAY